MALGAYRFALAHVAAPTIRVMPLAASGADSQDIGPRLVGRGIGCLMTLVASRLLHVGRVPEVVERKCRAQPGGVLNCVGLLRVTGLAIAKLLIRLVNVATVTLGMLGKACLDSARVKPMARGAFGRAIRHLRRVHLAFHFFRVPMVAM